MSSKHPNPDNPEDWVLADMEMMSQKNNKVTGKADLQGTVVATLLLVGLVGACCLYAWVAVFVAR